MKAPIYSSEWPSDIKTLHWHDIQEVWDPAMSPHVYNMYQNQLDIYRDMVPHAGAKVLDVGCAQGTLALLLAEAGHDVTAVDLRQAFLDYAASRYESGKIQFIQRNALSEEIPGEYDVIFANQIIEHLVYPVDLISKLRRNLKPCGRIVVTTPNWNYFINDLPSFRELGNPDQWADKQFTADGDGHFFLYTAQELSEVFAAAGFLSPTIRYFETPAISGHYKVRHLHRIFPSGWLRMIDRMLLRSPKLARLLSQQLMISAERELPDTELVKA